MTDPRDLSTPDPSVSESSSSLDVPADAAWRLAQALSEWSQTDPLSSNWQRLLEEICLATQSRGGRITQTVGRGAVVLAEVGWDAQTLPAVSVVISSRFGIECLLELAASSLAPREIKTLLTPFAHLMGLTAAGVRASNAAVEFIEAATHDLRSELSQCLRIAQRGRETGPQAGVLDEAIGSLERANELLRQLSIYSTAHLTTESIRTVSLAEAVQDVRWRCKALLDQTGGSLRTQTESDLGVKAKLHLLHDVLSRVVENSLRYAGPSPVVYVDWACLRGGRAQVCVWDSGTGFEEKYLDRIFKPFERLHPKKISGFGLGLAICRRAIESIDGQIRGEIGPGGGLLIRLSLPVE